MPFSHQKEARRQNTSVLLRDPWRQTLLSKAMRVLTNLCVQPLWERSVFPSVHSSQETVLAEAEVLTAAAIEQARERAITLLGIGVGIPGIVDQARRAG